MKKSLIYSSTKLRSILNKLSYRSLDDLEEDMITDSVSEKRKKIMASLCSDECSGGFVQLPGSIFSTHDLNGNILVIQTQESFVSFGLAKSQSELFI